jgi:hypothetical protein
MDMLNDPIEIYRWTKKFITTSINILFRDSKERTMMIRARSSWNAAVRKKIWKWRMRVRTRQRPC